MLVFLLMSQCIFVYFPSWTQIVQATEVDEICPQKPMMCVECNTQQNDFYCADPFNMTLLDRKLVPMKECPGVCVKWVKKSKETGLEQYIRTCSENLHITMQINMVCIRESRSGYGHLCFCNKDRCNTAPSIQSYQLWSNLLSFLTTLLISIFTSVVLQRQHLLTLANRR